MNKTVQKQWFMDNVKEWILNSEFVFFLFSDGLDAYIGVASMQVNALIIQNFPKHLQKSLKVLLKKSYLGTVHIYITYITFRGDAGKEKMAIFTQF